MFSPWLLAMMIFSGPTTDWPGWRGANGNGTATLKGATPTGVAIAWKKEVGLGYGSISIADNLAISTDSNGTTDGIIALDPKTGATRWRTAVAPT